VNDPPVPEQYRVAGVVNDLVYTEPGWAETLEADLYLPDREDPRPVVLMVHGGGWAARDREDMNGISQDLVRNGYAVLNVNYRFAPTYRYPAQLLDLQQALKWMVRNADRYNLDVDRINTWGYSSGAHLAALIASYNYSENYMVEYDRELPRIKAVVAGGIPSDLRKYEDGPILRRFLGGSRDQLPDTYADASPAYHISPNDPPVFLYHGKLDVLVTVDQATDYYDALLAQGIDAELYLHDVWGHAMMFLLGGDAEAEAIAFLNRNNTSIGTQDL